MPGINFRQAVSMGVGAMVGGGIFAVLGIAIQVAGRAVILSYIIAGIIALASGYSYAKLTLYLNDEGGSFTFLEYFLNDDRPAAFVGWTLILGYIGSIAMYAYTFGAFSAEMIAEYLPVSKFIIRLVVSLLVLAIFLIINLQGIQSSAESEFWMVFLKMLILFIVSIIGLVSLALHPAIASGATTFFSKGYTAPILAISTIFVSYQGFQLLSYEYEEMEDREHLIMRGIITSILISATIYLLISFVTSTIVPPKLIKQKGETVLAYVLFNVFSSSVLKQISFVVIVIAALFSTASAINATLFGTARLAARIAGDHDLPAIFSFKDKSQTIPTHSLIIITVITALLTGLGSLKEITGFASLSFLIIFFVVSWVLIRTDKIDYKKPIVYVSLFGTPIVIVLYLVNLVLHNLRELFLTLGIYGAILVMVLLFFEEQHHQPKNKQNIASSSQNT